jgi:hypothetical protein
MWLYFGLEGDVGAALNIRAVLHDGESALSALISAKIIALPKGGRSGRGRAKSAPLTRTKLMLPDPMHPSPPAFETAATSSACATNPIPAWKIGYLIPKRSHLGAFGTNSKFIRAPHGPSFGVLTARPINGMWQFQCQVGTRQLIDRSIIAPVHVAR